MAFTVTLKIQGVGLYVPDRSGESLMVLFPNQETAHQRGIPRALETKDSEGTVDIDRHDAFVEFSKADLNPDSEDTWDSLPAAGKWVGVDAPGARPPRLTMNGGPSAVPPLSDVLESVGLGDFSNLDPRALPGSMFDPGLLAFGLWLEAGELSIAEEYKAAYRFSSGTDDLDRGGSIYSSVLKVELGEVQDFTLLTRPLADVAPNCERPFDPRCDDVFGAPTRLEFKPRFDEVEIWIRHFCGLIGPDGEPRRERPNPSADAAEAGESDVDFVLNYALSERLEELVQQETELPIPYVAGSWAGGEPTGGKPNKCAGARR